MPIKPTLKTKLEKDDGKSFDVGKFLHSGKISFLDLWLAGMRERVKMIGENFLMESVPGQSIIIQVRIPIGDGTRNQKHQ